LIQVRMDSLTNKQVPDLRATTRAAADAAGVSAAAIQAQLDEIGADVDRSADVAAGPDE
jgi:hypothetical protein